MKGVPWQKEAEQNHMGACKVIREQQLHVTIAVFLNRALPLGAWHTALDHSGKQSYVTAAMLKARGAVRGVPDHLALVPGFVPIFLEVKTDIGRLSDAQLATADDIKRAGGAWYCVRSVEDAEAALRDVGVPLRATVGEIRTRIAAQNEGLKPKPAAPKRARTWGKPSARQIARVRRAGLLV